MDLKNDFIQWPDEERKEGIKRWFKENKTLLNAVGVVDGAPFPFDSAPSYDPISWNTRRC
ncbi:hypothetical protein BGX26_003253, partial [Mortierella sp. AD094]